MELQQFVKAALKQIMDGVREAQAECAGSGGDINPQGLGFMEKQIGERRWDVRTQIFAESVEFDVAVTAEHGAASKGEIGIIVGALSLGAVKEADSKNGSFSRIRFAVPVLLSPGGQLRHTSGGPVTR